MVRVQVIVVIIFLTIHHMVRDIVKIGMTVNCLNLMRLRKMIICRDCKKRFHCGLVLSCPEYEKEA